MACSVGGSGKCVIWTLYLQSTNNSLVVSSISWSSVGRQQAVWRNTFPSLSVTVFHCSYHLLPYFLLITSYIAVTGVINLWFMLVLHWHVMLHLSTQEVHAKNTLLVQQRECGFTIAGDYSDQEHRGLYKEKMWCSVYLLTVWEYEFSISLDVVLYLGNTMAKLILSPWQRKLNQHPDIVNQVVHWSINQSINCKEKHSLATRALSGAMLLRAKAFSQWKNASIWIPSHLQMRNKTVYLLLHTVQQGNIRLCISIHEVKLKIEY